MFMLAVLMCPATEPVRVAADSETIPSMVAALKQKDRMGKWKAIEALGDMDALAADATPDLIELMEEKDEGTRACVWLALMHIGPPAVPHLVHALRSKDPTRRLHAVEALNKLGRQAVTAIDALSAVVVGDSDMDVRFDAIKTIRHTQDKKAVAALLTLAKQDDAQVRRGALEALTDLGPLAKPALPVFVDLMDDPGGLEELAAWGLMSIGDKDAAAALANILCDPDKTSAARCQAAWALARMPAHTAVAVPALIRASQADDVETRKEVASYLRFMEADAHEAAPALRWMMSDPVPDVRIEAAWGLYAVGGPDDLAVKALVSESHSRDPLVRADAVYVLGEVGKNQKVAVEALVARLTDEQPRVRRTAVRALGKVGRPTALSAIPHIENLLSDPDPDIRAEVSQTLSDLKGR